MSEKSCVPVVAGARILGVVQYPLDEGESCTSCNWAVPTLFVVEWPDGTQAARLCPECFARHVLNLPTLPIEEQDDE